MANQNFVNQHNLNLLKTALPFLSPNIQKSVEVISKADEFVSMVKSPVPAGELSTMSLSAPMDMESVLMHLKSASNKNEQELIDNMINIMKMQKMMQSYRSFMKARPSSESSDSSGSSSSQDTMMEFLLSQLNPDQRGNFENISVVLNAMNN